MVPDLFLVGIISSLIANGLTELITYSVRGVKDVSKHKDSIRSALQADGELRATIENIIRKIDKAPVAPSSELQMALIQSFLESPTAESIVRQIYADFVPEGTEEKTTAQLKEEFQLCLAYHLGVTRQYVQQLAADLFEVISKGCRKAFNLSIEQGLLSAHEAKSIARQRIVLDELRAIRSNLDFLTKRSDLDLNATQDFEKRYRQQVGERSRQITVPHFDKAPRLDINKIFVSPSFIFTPKEKRSEPERISLDRFLAHLYRSVLLGDPGGGKSTLAQKICYELCENYDGRRVGGRLLTPVLVVLREYSSKKKKDGSSIVQFMESEVTSKYQLPRAAPPQAFEYLLHNGHLLVIFDGLDELLDPSHRREISKDIESFCSLFPSVPVLVTSRVVGYEKAPLDPNRFEAFRIAPFDEEQVTDYAKKWFYNDTELSPEESEGRAQAFLRESKIAADLRSNPLMLALMCNLYRRAGFIPRNRPEVYKKCSEMLFERWDASRGIWVHLPISEPRVLLSHLAHWIYSNESLQSGVTDNQLIKESTRFLCPRRFEIEEEAEKAACQFLEICKGRAWVFTDVGTTAEGSDLYKFTHKTFLEYFTAADIVRNNNSPEKLWTLLGPKIAGRSWDVVAQLAFQMLHEQVEGASDELSMLLLQDSEKNKQNRWSYLSFGARCLQFIYPSPKTIRALTEASVRCVIEGGLDPRHREFVRHFPSSDPPSELIRALLLVAPECRPTVAHSLQNEIIDYTKSTDDKVILRAIDLGLILYFPLFLLRHGAEDTVEQEPLEFWKRVVQDISDKTDAKLESLASHHFLAFRHWFDRHALAIEKLFEWYTPDHLFVRQPHTVFDDVVWTPIADRFLEFSSQLGTVVEQTRFKKIEELLQSAAALGQILLHTALPCFSAETLSSALPSISWLIRRKLQKGAFVQLPSISWEAIFGFWCLWATIAEMRELQNELVVGLEEPPNPGMQAIMDVIKARMRNISWDEALRSLERFNPPTSALQFIKRWITGEVSFVKPPVPGKSEKEKS